MRLYNGIRIVDGPCLDNIQRLDSGCIPMVLHMARTGLQVDLDHFAKLEKALIDDMDRITEEVRSMTGHYCNLDSGDQVADLLFKKLGLKQARPKFTKSGDRESVADEILTAIQHTHEVVPKIQDYKELSKLKGTYVSPMPKLARRMGDGTWRMFPHFSTTRVPSGRLSCKEPNLLAIPTRSARGKDIRRGFVAPDGWKIVSIDYSQIEPRITTHKSQDENLLKVYKNEEDIYSDFAIAAFKIKDQRHKDEKGEWKYPGVLKMEHRYPAKTCVLATFYRVTAKGLLEQMPVVCGNCNKEAKEHTCGKFWSLWNEDKCQDLINAFFLRYPGVLEMWARDDSRARRYGYIWDMWGRILHTAAVRSVHPWVVQAALREAGNFPIQAGAGGCLKLSMAWVWYQIVDSLLEVMIPILQVHDELLFYVRDDLVEDCGALVSYAFENLVPLSIPVKAGVEWAQTWGDLKK